jgi:hypothetical protein
MHYQCVDSTDQHKIIFGHSSYDYHEQSGIYKSFGTIVCSRNHHRQIGLSSDYYEQNKTQGKLPWQWMDFGDHKKNYLDFLVTIMNKWDSWLPNDYHEQNWI